MHGYRIRTSVLFGGSFAVPPPGYPAGSYCPLLWSLPSVPPAMGPIVMPSLQLVDQSGQANVSMLGAADVAQNSTSCQSDPPHPCGPCHACGQAGHFHRDCLNLLYGKAKGKLRQCLRHLNRIGGKPSSPQLVLLLSLLMDWRTSVSLITILHCVRKKVSPLIILQ